VIREDTNALIGDRVLPLSDFPVFNIKPISGGSQLTHELAPYFLDWLAHPTYDSYWKQWSIEENYQNVRVPGLTIAAWYDLFQDGSLRNYLGLKAHAGNQAARDGQHLIIAIGGHSGGSRKVGDVDFRSFTVIRTRWTVRRRNWPSVPSGRSVTVNVDLSRHTSGGVEPICPH
jgi:uncharacterized protein